MDGSIDSSMVDPKAMVTWVSHQTVYSCVKHGVIGKGSKNKTVCDECEKLDEKKRPTKKPKGNLERIKLCLPIGDFHRDTVNFIKEKYHQHKFLVTVLGHKMCLLDRDPIRILEMEPMAALIVRDYTDRIKAEYNHSAMSTGMGGGNPTIGMEGFLYHHRNQNNGNNDVEIQMKWFSYLSDWKTQDAHTSYNNLFKFITHLQKNLGLLPRHSELPPGLKKSVLYIRSDGCANQYKCGCPSLEWLASGDF